MDPSVIVFNVDPASDGDPTRRPRSNVTDRVQSDNWYLEKLGVSWASDKDTNVAYDPRKKYRFDKLPAGYAAYERTATSRKAGRFKMDTDRWVYGGNRVFTSFAKFYPHFKHLQIVKTPVGCPCDHCDPHERSVEKSTVNPMGNSGYGASDAANSQFHTAQVQRTTNHDEVIQEEAIWNFSYEARFLRSLQDLGSAAQTQAESDAIFAAVHAAYYLSIAQRAWILGSDGVRQAVLERLAISIDTIALGTMLRSQLRGLTDQLNALPQVHLEWDNQGPDPVEAWSFENANNVEHGLFILATELIGPDPPEQQPNYRFLIDAGKAILHSRSSFDLRLGIACLIHFIAPAEAIEVPWASDAKFLHRYGIWHAEQRWNVVVRDVAASDPDTALAITGTYNSGRAMDVEDHDMAG